MRTFKFFHGYTNSLTAVWMPETDGRDYYDITEQLTRQLSNNIAEEIDNNIIDTLTRMVNEGDSRLIGRNVNFDYLEYYLDMGGQRA
jgi:hypothetical protein